MKKNYYLILFFILLYPFLSQAQKKYNVIFINVDDESIAIDAFNNPQAPSPNLARLMQRGMLFKQTYCQYSLCSPSRTSILSGKRVDSTGIIDNETSIRTNLGSGYRFLNEYFHDFGYRTESFGKYTCKHEDEISWDYYYNARFDFLALNDDEEGQGNEKIQSPNGLAQTPSYYIDTLNKTLATTDDGLETEQLLGKIRQPVATPYFYNLGLETHNPYTPMLKYWNLVGDSINKELLAVSDIDTTKLILGNGSSNITFPNTPLDDQDDIPEVALKKPLLYPVDESKRIRHSYYSEIAQKDANLGQVLDLLDSLNIWDSSIVVFWSDHGLQLGEHHTLWLKLCLFDETQRVPLVICAPGKKTGICNAGVELIDLFPTLAELCGLPAPQGMHGSSLVPLLENPDITWTKAIFSQLNKTVVVDPVEGRAVRTNTFHYNNWEEYGEELYDMINDPNEWTNLAINHPEFIDSLNKMRDLLAGGWEAALPPAYPKKYFYKDADGDGYGSNIDSMLTYFLPQGYSTIGGDCNDFKFAVHPGAKEQRCNGVDDNCNNKIDENKPYPTITPLGDLDICNAGFVDLRTNGGAEFSYQWRKDGFKIAGATNRLLQANVEGEYKVTITHSSGCSNTSHGIIVNTNSCKAIINNGRSISDNSIAANSIAVYPNPAKNLLNVNFVSSQAISVQIQVFDMKGKVLLQKIEKANYGSNNFQLDLKNLISGTYYLELGSDIRSERIKFIVNR